jgi:hypothetical protein
MPFVVKMGVPAVLLKYFILTDVNLFYKRMGQGSALCISILENFWKNVYLKVLLKIPSI